MEEMSLLAHFEQARQIHSPHPTPPPAIKVQSTLRKGIEALRGCDDMVSKLGLFSSNEPKDDVGTANLKYLLDDRLQVLKMSHDQLKEFISICEALEVVPEEEIETPMQGADTAAARRAKKNINFPSQNPPRATLRKLDYSVQTPESCRSKVTRN